MRVAGAFSCLLAAGCSGLVGLPQLARDLREQEVRTLVMEPGFTLVSPYGPGRTASYARQIQRNLAAVSDLFQVELPETLLAYLEPAERVGSGAGRGAGPAAAGEPAAAPARHRVLGSAGRLRGGGGFVLIVKVPRELAPPAADGRSPAGIRPVGAEPVIRHEAAHLGAILAGLQGPTWFDEGLALEIQSMDLSGERLLPGARQPPTLAIARRLHRRFPLERVLDWEERGDRVASGEEKAFPEGRPLAHALLRFLLERQAGGSLRDRLTRVKALSRADILALEDAWRAWLDAQGPVEA